MHSEILQYGLLVAIVLFMVNVATVHADTCTLYKPHNIANARENIKRYKWAKDIMEGWKRSVQYAMQQDKEFFEEMIPALTPWPSYGQNCPVCVGRLSSMGECGIYKWSIREPDKLTCKYCGTTYPNPEYPETGSMTAPKMGQTFNFYLTEEERAHPEDKSGRYAFRWVGWPVHTSWSGMIRARKAGWCIGRILTLAKLYAVTGEVEYAEHAVWIIDRMARVYPNWLYHSYDGTYADCPPGEAAAEMGRNPRAGKFPIETIITAFSGRHTKDDYAVLNNGFWGAGRFGCSGSDGGTILNVIVAYDLIREARYPDGAPVINPEIEERIVNDLILAGCEDSENWDDINNKCGPARALSAAVGIMFQRPQSVRRALQGFTQLMNGCFHFDGFCDESPSYSGMHLNLMRNIPEILLGYSDPEGYQPESGPVLRDFDPFQHIERYRLALESMVRMLDPNRQYPVIGDTHKGGGISPIYAEILTDHYGRKYAGLLEEAQGAELSQRGSEYALWRRDPDMKADHKGKLPMYSEWFPGWHVAVMRGGPVSKHTAFYLNGYEYGGHRHMDTLGIIYIAHGRELASDRGYIWDDPRNAWTKSTLAHNIVTVDGINQNVKSRFSTLELFGSGPGIEVTQASANSYEQCDQYRRTCALVQISGEQTYAVDFFRVRGGKLHQYCLNCSGELVKVTGAELKPVDQEIKWLKNLRAGNPQKPFTVTWQDENVMLDAMVLNQIDRLIVADAPGWRSDSGEQLNAPPIQQILAERIDAESATSQYAVIMVPYVGEQSPVKSARLIVNDPDSGAMAIAIELADRTDYVISSLDYESREYGPVAMTGHFGFVSVDSNGQVSQSYLLDGTELRHGIVNISLPKPQIPLKVASVKGRTFQLEGQVPDGVKLAGTYLLAGNTGYEIESAGGKSITVRDYPAVECDTVRILRDSQ